MSSNGNLRKLALTALAACSGCYGIATAQPADAQATGFHVSLLDESGGPIAGGLVSYARVPRSEVTPEGRYRDAPGEVRLSGTASSQADGSVSVSALPPGRYLICAEAPGYLNTCEWSTAIEFVMGDGQPADVGSARLTKAGVVRITVNDIHQLLPPDNPSSAPLIVGVYDDTERFHVARQASAVGTSRVMAVPVPYGRQMRLWLYSSKLRIEDASGSVLQSGGLNSSFTLGPTAASPVFTVNVAGPAE